LGGEASEAARELCLAAKRGNDQRKARRCLHAGGSIGAVDGCGGDSTALPASA
jgi:hypothetical protein